MDRAMCDECYWLTLFFVVSITKKCYKSSALGWKCKSFVELVIICGEGERLREMRRWEEVLVICISATAILYIGVEILQEQALSF